MNIKRNNIIILSGGQTGVDRAALDFALGNEMTAIGWCPLGRIAEDGIIPTRYPLNESHSPDPMIRTELNVIHSDGVLIIVFNDMDDGTLLAYNIARMHMKPVFVWKIFKNTDPAVFQRWLEKNEITRLNVAGPRESNAPGIYETTIGLLETLFIV